MLERYMRPDGWHSITPRLVADAERLVSFLINAFDARGEFRADVPSVLCIGDSNVMISSTQARPQTSSFLHLYVDDADATYARAIAAGATSLEEPADMPYGDRRAIISDPSGNVWQLATYRG